MKEGIHPNYQSVVFMDTSSGQKWLTRTTMTSKETVQWEDGKTYPLIKVDISSYSHPYFTGKMKYVDAAGRVEKFQKKYKWAGGAAPTIATDAAPAAAPAKPAAAPAASAGAKKPAAKAASKAGGDKKPAAEKKPDDKKKK